MAKFSLIIQFLVAFITFVLLIVSAVTTKWAILKNKVTGQEIAHFGLWVSCKTTRDNVKTCKDFSDGEFTIVKFLNESTFDKVEIYDGKNIPPDCYNMTEQETITGNTTHRENKTEVLCQFDKLYSLKQLDRCRVFTILPIVVCFVVTVLYLKAIFQESARGFFTPIMSVMVPLWATIGIGNFTSYYGSHFELVSFQYGWSYILAWVGIGASLYCILYSFSILLAEINKENASFMEAKSE